MLAHKTTNSKTSSCEMMLPTNILCAKQPTSAILLATKTPGLHLNLLFTLVIKTKFLIRLDGSIGEHGQIVNSIVTVLNYSVDVDIGIAGVIKEARYITIMHGINAQHISR
jgi:hypothetical protein